MKYDTELYCLHSREHRSSALKSCCVTTWRSRMMRSWEQHPRHTLYEYDAIGKEASNAYVRIACVLPFSFPATRPLRMEVNSDTGTVPACRHLHFGMAPFVTTLATCSTALAALKAVECKMAQDEQPKVQDDDIIDTVKAQGDHQASRVALDFRSAVHTCQIYPFLQIFLSAKHVQTALAVLGQTMNKIPCRSPCIGLEAPVKRTASIRGSSC